MNPYAWQLVKLNSDLLIGLVLSLSLLTSPTSSYRTLVETSVRLLTSKGVAMASPDLTLQVFDTLIQFFHYQ